MIKMLYSELMKLRLELIFIIFVPLECIFTYILYVMGWPLSSNIVLFVGLLGFTCSIYGIIYNAKSNNENIEKQLEKSRINTLLQSRYRTEKLAIFELNVFLMDTLVVYYHIKKLDVEKENYLKPKYFLLFQYLCLITNHDLLSSLPSSLIKKIQKTIINIDVEEKIESDCYEIIENFFQEHPTPPETSMFLITEYYEFYKLIRDKWDTSASFQFIFCKFLEKGIKENVLKAYFEEILNIISKNTIENLILKDNDIILQSPLYNFKLDAIKRYNE